ncbi:putative Ion channel [Taphrina deformans PYCC 5710]|uniref:Ion channel n=1 Tax=Taphrina deformans (strain PYCC 5710 / ATCC 11124 / CBS 356.35 / IMI 108563 / JCM 9778 / NBRC 8474) TaxID=1097556 RepID=R4X9J4_TAPDE|nr:putative Ion channel [Taphrina deformans PYCC 5710]|eukprot:CCG82395.1 putative Ion channel [Taphrina deformans PYCC 5710]
MDWFQNAQPTALPPRRTVIRELPLHLVDTSNKVIDQGTAVYHDFVSFCGRDNVIEVAVALIIGSAFTAVSVSLVTDILTPLLSLVPFLNRNLVNKFVVLSCGHGPNVHKDSTLRSIKAECKYNTLAQAATDGAITLSYGKFFETSLQFLISACSLYLMIKSIQLFWHKKIVKETQNCRYCRKEISKNASRCGFCTSWMDGREEQESTSFEWPKFNGLDEMTNGLFRSSPIDAKQKRRAD